MDISTIIVSYNTSNLLQEAVTKLRESSRNFKTEIIFVDNASVDDSVHQIQTLFPESRLIVNKSNVGLVGPITKRFHSQLVDLSYYLTQMHLSLRTLWINASRIWIPIASAEY